MYLHPLYTFRIDVDYKRLPITAGSTDVQIEVVGLSPGTMYMFVVSGVNPAGEGSLSNVLSAKTMDSGKIKLYIFHFVCLL